MYPNCFEDVAKGIPIFNNERVTYHCVYVCINLLEVIHYLQ